MAYVKLSLTNCLYVIAGSPLTAMTFVILYSILFDFERVSSDPELYKPCIEQGMSVKLHLPSITQCFTKYWPQTWVWWIGMAFPMWPRLVVPWLFFKAHTSKCFIRNSKFGQSTLIFLANVAYWADIVENLALVGITFFVNLHDDNEQFPETKEYKENTKNVISLVHTVCFSLFLFSSSLYITSTMILHYQCDLAIFKHSLNIKKILVSLFAISVPMASAFYFLRFTNPCIDHVGTVFAIFEYTVVYSVIGFHFRQAIDFKAYGITLHPMSDGFDMSDEKDKNEVAELIQKIEIEC